MMAPKGGGGVGAVDRDTLSLSSHIMRIANDT